MSFGAIHDLDAKDNCIIDVAMDEMDAPSWERTDELSRLLSPEFPNRDSAWFAKTGDVAYRAALVLGKEGFIVGKDGNSYLCLEFPETKVPNPTSIEVLLDKAVEQKSGVLIGDPDLPYFWLSHGAILSLKLYGQVSPPMFYGYVQPKQLSSPLKSKQMIGGTPNEQMLPTLVRESVRHFFRTKGIKRSGVVAMLNESGVPVLFFELACDRNDSMRQKELYFGLSWYMPSCIPYAAVPSDAFQKGFPDL